MRLGRLISRAALATAAVMALSGAAANAAVVFQNPDPISSSTGNVDGWNITNGFAVSDSFTLTSSSTLSSVDFLVWTSSGFDLTAIDWTISSGPGGAGTTFGGALGAPVTEAFQGTNSFGFDLNLDTFSLAGLNLGAGTYWLTLQNGNVIDGVSVYWDQGGGPSGAWQNTEGDPSLLQPNGTCGSFDQADTTNGSCAETFEINGTSEQVPEPVALSLFGAGLIGAAALRRRKAKTA